MVLTGVTCFFPTKSASSEGAGIRMVVFINSQTIFARNYASLCCPHPIMIMTHSDPSRDSTTTFKHSNSVCFCSLLFYSVLGVQYLICGYQTRIVWITPAQFTTIRWSSDLRNERIRKPVKLGKLITCSINIPHVVLATLKSLLSFLNNQILLASSVLQGNPNLKEEWSSDLVWTLSSTSECSSP